MKDEERIRSLHARMDHLNRVREKRKTGAIGSACIVIAACLILLLFGSGMPYTGGTAGMYSGASMLFGNAGGYVLVAIVAFTSAVIITVLCIRHQREPKETLGGNNNREENDYEE